MNMNDTAKEGDTERLLQNSKYLIPFYHQHSNLSKYMVENIDFVLKCNHFASPQMCERILSGTFQNMRGGKGNNCESYVVMEHYIRYRK